MKRRQATAARAPAADHGATGAAMQRRRSLMVPSDVAGVEYRQMVDGSPLGDIRLSQRQREAAAYLRGLWSDSLPAMEMPMGFGNGGRAGERHLTHDEYLAAAVAWRDYREAMAGLSQICGPRISGAIRRVVIDHEPAAAGDVRDGLTFLADEWRLK